MTEVGSGTLTLELAERLRASFGRLPAGVRREARRSLLNVLGTAIGASRTPAVEAVLAVGRRLGASGDCVVPGRPETTDRHHAVLATGIAAHLDDFDDTHLVTVIHPAAATLAGLLPLAVDDPGRGCEFLDAFALGIEAQLRVGLAMSPSHYDEGWHITGTVGAIGAAAAAALFAGLEGERLATALALAASQPLGHRESFGTMEKSFHPGKAAAWGVRSATLAAAGVSADLDVFAGRNGYFGLLAGSSDPDSVLAAWGERWEILANTYKPYPCGIVCHPAIDAAVALSARVDPDAVEWVRVHCNPLVVELTGNPDPHDGLEARFSTIHAVAAALADGRAGLAQYEDARVLAPDLVRLRALTRLAPDAAIPRHAVRLEVGLRGGRAMEERVEHARGSLERPLTDDELLDKVSGLVDPVLPGRAPALAAAVAALCPGGRLEPLLAAVRP